MLKGCQKRVIVLRGKSGDIFEEAYFILRSGRDREGFPEMLCEANRIIEASRSSEPRRASASRASVKLIFFILGLFVGAGLILISAAIT